MADIEKVKELLHKMRDAHILAASTFYNMEAIMHHRKEALAR